MSCGLPSESDTLFLFTYLPSSIVIETNTYAMIEPRSRQSITYIQFSAKDTSYTALHVAI